MTYFEFETVDFIHCCAPSVDGCVHLPACSCQLGFLTDVQELMMSVILRGCQQFIKKYQKCPEEKMYCMESVLYQSCL